MEERGDSVQTRLETAVALWIADRIWACGDRLWSIGTFLENVGMKVNDAGHVLLQLVAERAERRDNPPAVLIRD